VLLALLALPALALIGLVVLVVIWSRTDYPLGGAPEKVPCAEALAFGGAKLPDDARDTACTVQAWQDTAYSATFRMPRSGVRDWLAGTYPQAPAETRFCGQGVDLCLDLNPPLKGMDADAVKVEVVYEGAGTARVSFSAFTV
jgi:hypothetical protein